MSLKHFKSMLMKSAQIQRAIEHEQQRRWPDWIRLLRLKKVRLAIKDRIMRLAHQPWKIAPRKAQLRYRKLQNV